MCAYKMMPFLKNKVGTLFISELIIYIYTNRKM